MRRKRRWTKRECHKLRQGVSVYGLAWFPKHLKRSIQAVRNKAARLYGPGGLRRGAYTLSGACEFTGYTVEQLRLAQYALAQKWKRQSKTGPYLIYEDQLTELVAWLKRGYWCRKFHLYSCIWCTTEGMPHRALGLCKKCYQSYVAYNKRHKLPTQIKILLTTVKSRSIDVTELSVSNMQRGMAPTRCDLRKVADGIAESY